MQTKINLFGVLGWSVVLSILFMVPSAWADGGKKDWTMLVYINGHNNLDEYGAMNINQMEKVGSNDHLNIVVQWASMAASSTKRLYVTKDNDEATVTSPVVQDMPIVDMGDKNSLLDFIKWGVSSYPADHYMVVVWNHGNGWHFGKDGIRILDISYDDRSGHHITTEELGRVMGDAAQYIGHKIDIYGSDACLMAMIEVATEMGDAVDTFVGSEQTIPLEGWPYDKFLTAWMAQPSASNHEIGKMLTAAYKEFYKGRDGQTFSTIDMSELPALVEEMGGLGAKLATVPNLAQVKKSAESSTRFALSDYVDIGDLVKNVKSNSLFASDARVELDKVAAQLSKTVVASAVTGSTKANGLSVWWPIYSSTWTNYKDRYLGLKFDKASQWSSFLKNLFKQ
jgi:Clostripain family